MLSPEERRQRLEALLARVRRNRQGELAGDTVEELQQADGFEAATPVPVGLELPVTGEELADERTIESTDGFGFDLELEGEGAEPIGPSRSVELDTAELTALTVSEALLEPSAEPSFELESGVIELTADAEVASEEPFAGADTEEVSEPIAREAAALAAEPAAPVAPLEPPAAPRRAAAPEPPSATPLPEVWDEPWPSSVRPEEPRTEPSMPVSLAEEDDDEPEIEVSYESEEALALSEELGLSEAELEDEAERAEDLQLHPADRPTPAALTPGLSPAERDEPAGPGPLPDLPPPRVVPFAPPLGGGLPPVPALDLPARPAAAAPTSVTPRAERYQGAEPPVGAAVVEVLREAPPARARTLGDLLREALLVGHGF